MPAYLGEKEEAVPLDFELSDRTTDEQRANKRTTNRLPPKTTTDVMATVTRAITDVDGPFRRGGRSSLLPE